MNDIFKKGETLYEQGNYEKSFRVFKEISDSTDFCMEIRSDAYNMMGAILIGVAPWLAVENEINESVTYFKRALALDDSNLGALLNSIQFFGDSFGHHKDYGLLETACNGIKSHFAKLSREDVVMVKEKCTN